MYYINNFSNEFKKLSAEGFITNEEGVAQNLFRQKRFSHEDSLINWSILNFKNQEKIFVDIGAHIGTYSWSLAPYFKNVVSFEPNREVYNCLCANSFMKGLSHKITTHCAGIGDGAYVAKYNDRGIDGGANGFAITELYDNEGEGRTISQYKIKVNTLDSYKFSDVGFIKIDVEGFEKEVFLGATETIKRNDYPPVLFESWAPGAHPNLSNKYTEELRKELFKIVEDIGYNINRVDGWSEVFLATKKL